MAELVWPDVEEWLCGYLRGVLAGRGIDAVVSNKEPAEGAFPAALVVVRSDGGSRTSQVTSQWSVGVSVLAGTRLFDGPAVDLVRPVFGVLTDDDLPVLGGPACPIASIDEVNGWYAVSEAEDRSRMYFTVTYTVVGSPSR